MFIIIISPVNVSLKYLLAQSAFFRKLQEGDKTGFVQGDNPLPSVSAFISGSLVPALGATVPALAGVVAAALPVIAVIAVIGAAIAALYWVWTNNINGIQENTRSIVENIKEILGKLPEWLAQKIRDGITLVVEAATDLGADRFTAFQRVVLPLATPGIITGIMFVFIPALGNFVVPDILGGSDSFMIGNTIKNQFMTVRNWSFGSALSVVLMFTVLLGMSLYLRQQDRSKVGMEGLL